MTNYLWMQVCEILKWHNQGNDRCIDTLNRLWRKHSQVCGADGEEILAVPTLSEDKLTVRSEHWSLDQLAALRREHRRDSAASFPPVIVLEWSGRTFLIDGNNRVNFWLKQGNAGPHLVFKLIWPDSDS